MSDGPLTAKNIPFHSQERVWESAFTAAADARYLLKIGNLGMVLEVDRLRWERHELHGELTVRCDLSGAHVIDGILTSGTFNLSSTNARRDRAKWMADRAQAPLAQVVGALEELCQRVLNAERVGKPATLLHALPKPTPEDVIDVEGVVLPSRHPAILFGDGGCGKSYLALLILGTLAKRGHRVLYVDWELDGRDHRERLERLFGAEMPHVHYARCDRPMVAEADRLRRLVAQHQIEYAVFDSVAFACDGPPESAEAAAGYFRAVRQLGTIGSLHLAHVTKPGNDVKSDKGEYKPFGSVFWHNSARACWFIKRTEPTNDNDGRVIVGLYHRKSNLAGLQKPVGLELLFGESHTSVMRADLSEVAELAKGLPIWQRMKSVLVGGPMSIEDVAEELDVKADTVRRTATRMDMFTKVETGDGRKLIALVSRRVA